jgi:hypothetical protein
MKQYFPGFLQIFPMRTILTLPPSASSSCISPVTCVTSVPPPPPLAAAAHSLWVAAAAAMIKHSSLKSFYSVVYLPRFCCAPPRFSTFNAYLVSFLVVFIPGFLLI